MLRPLRRLLVFCVLAAALLPATAAADLQPVRRDFGELQIPRVRAGVVTIPAGHARGVVTMIVALRQPPLAAYAGRALAGRAGAHKLNVRSASSRAYLARLAVAQRRAAVELKRAIPEATFGRSFRVVLNALTVRVPSKRVPALARLSFVRTLFPSLRYTLALNRSPSVIGADQFWAGTGMRGDGVKIGVVDDGIDWQNPFFDPNGYAFPPGFPKGQLEYTSQKVIVARSYPGPGSGKEGRLPLDRRASFHGTHVAGIAAGDAGTTAPAGPDHPQTPGLSGVAPRAQLGNYRVFNAPTPVGNSAFTPQIVAAFEDAVADGMDVINFSGGGPQNDPDNDALVEAVANVAAAGVVPVISAGNDRDEFGLGSAGAPGTAPDAISVAAVSNSHIFSPGLTVTSPGGIGTIPIQTGAPQIPAAWASSDQPLVDVGTIVGRDGKPVDRYLCGSADNPNIGPGTLPPSSLNGVIALASRGLCTFVSKAERAKAAGAIGLVLVDNRSGEPNGIPVALAVPGGMISDLDGARLRAAMAATGGRATVRIGREPIELVTGRSGIPTSFSSAGLTPFGHDLKPDVSAPGASVLSSTLREVIGENFASFAGTSMAAPHVAGAAALLVQLHPTWGAPEVKSALMLTAGPAWADTARTQEAPIELEGAGLINVAGASDPQIFTSPQSLSFHYLDVTKGGTHSSTVVTVTDAGGGGGTWNIELEPQVASAGATVEVPPFVTVNPGGDGMFIVTARAATDAVPGDDFGFIVLTQGKERRRIPYGFLVTRPGLAAKKAEPLQGIQVGDTRDADNSASVYRFPAAPFGPPPSYSGPATNEPGGEDLYVANLNEPAVNMGVSVLLATQNSLIDPWFLASKDENDVTGYTGTPVNVNAFLLHYRVPVGAAGIQFPRQGQYFVSVDSGSDPFTGKSYPGQYLLRAWINDVLPPVLAPMTVKVAAGRPTLVMRTGDLQSGVDPLSLVIAYGRVLIGAAAYDPISGIAIFPLPGAAPALKVGRVPAILVSGDFQETKNVDQAGEIESILPNTAFARVRLQVVDAPVVTWLLPDRDECVAQREPLLVVASSPNALRTASFADEERTITTVKRNIVGLFSTTWRTRGAARGKHTLTVVVTDSKGRKASATRTVRVCKK
jgi:subtilisin family serine protease